jgi:hypothetical protein
LSDCPALSNLASRSIVHRPITLQSVLSPPPLVMSFAAQLPCIAHHLLVSPAPSSLLSNCLPPACLASSTIPSHCVIHCPLTPNILYLNLIISFLLLCPHCLLTIHCRRSFIDCCVPALITCHRRCQSPFSPLPHRCRTPTPLSKANAHCHCQLPPSFCVVLCSLLTNGIKLLSLSAPPPSPWRRIGGRMSRTITMAHQMIR